MKLPRNLNGSELAHHVCRSWADSIDHQTGSHIILDTHIPAKQRISIPSHKPLRIGMLSKILDAVAAHKQVSRDDILRGL